MNALVGYKAKEITGTGIIYAPYMPLIKVVPYKKSPDVVFREYVDSDEDMIDIYLSDVLNGNIVGLEQKDGTVVVYRKNVEVTKPLKNRKIFAEKYFTEAI